MTDIFNIKPINLAEFMKEQAEGAKYSLPETRRNYDSAQLSLGYADRVSSYSQVRDAYQTRQEKVGYDSPDMEHKEYKTPRDYFKELVDYSVN